VLKPSIEPVADTEPKDADEALRTLVQSRLEGLGPVTVTELAKPLSVEPHRVEAALAALENQGVAMRGQFTAAAPAAEWCERRLLARMRRYTLKRLRAEIEPVTAAAYMRFLCRWQHLDGERREGVDALAATLGQLEGFPLPAGAWETTILPARVGDYAPAMLDELCTSGRITWMRLFPPCPAAVGNGDRPHRSAGPLRSTPIALVARRNLGYWRALSTLPNEDEIELSSSAAEVRAVLGEAGASFFDDIVDASGLLRTQVETALAELVAWGLVTADSFTGLRALVQPSNRRPPFARRRYRQRSLSSAGIEAAGRWTLTRPQRPDQTLTEGVTEHIAGVLLARYGVVFRRVLMRESGLPPWRKLLYVYRRMEASGEIRGGRFVAGFSGEQFALPEAVGALRAARKRNDVGELVAVSAADPLNLMGIITPDERLPALAGNRVLYRDGVPAALQAGRDVRLLEKMPAESEWAIRNQLLRAGDRASYIWDRDRGPGTGEKTILHPKRRLIPEPIESSDKSARSYLYLPVNRQSMEGRVVVRYFCGPRSPSPVLPLETTQSAQIL
jgi:ATP-dependent Lhr-like helicase